MDAESPNTILDNFGQPYCESGIDSARDKDVDEVAYKLYPDTIPFLNLLSALHVPSASC